MDYCFRYFLLWITKLWIRYLMTAVISTLVKGMMISILVPFIDYFISYHFFLRKGMLETLGANYIFQFRNSIYFWNFILFEESSWIRNV